MSPTSSARHVPGTGALALRPDAIRLFESTVDRSPADRATFLDAHCTDLTLRAQVDELLAAHDVLERGLGAGARFLASLDPEHTAALLAAGAADDAAMWRDLPDQVGRYRVIRPLGRGGMGVVGLGYDPDLDRLAAIKLLPRDAVADANARTRFMVEARAGSSLDHPSIATIYEIGETERGQLFIAMAYYGDTTLRDRIAQGRVPVQDAVRIARDVAEGLSRSHERGIVHRDIKPANVIVTSDGGTRVIDFGLAKLAGTAITRPELRVGTAAYMSPEQTRGEPLDGRSDLWSLGVVMYEMLCGARPFAHESIEGLTHAIRHDPPAPLHERCPDVPPSLATVVARCLEKQQDRRFQSAAELAQALRGLDAGAAPSLPNARSRRIPAFLSGGALIGALGAGIMIATHAPTGSVPAGSPARSIAVVPFTNVGDDSATAYLAAGISDDILSTLGQIAGLRVVTHTSPFVPRGAADARTVGQRLGVGHVLEGSVQRAGSRLRVVVRLTDATAGAQLWSRRYDRDAADLFILEDEISRSVAGVLQLKVLPLRAPAAASKPRNLEAHDLYLRGRHAWNRRTEDGFREAIAWFRASLDRDSAYAAAYAGLADAYRLLGTYGFLPGSESFAEAEAAARRAVQLAPGSGEAHAALAGSLQAQRRYREADEAFREAISLDPSHAHARHWYAFLLATAGRMEEARRQIAEARSLDPLSVPIRVTEARLDLHAGAVRHAIASLTEGVAIDSTNPWAWYALGLAEARDGRVREAIEALQTALALTPNEPRLMAVHAALRVSAGDTAIAGAILARLRQNRSRESVAYALATAFTAMREPDSAFAWLGRVPWNSEYLFSLRVDPMLEPLRTDPRYRTLGVELGIPEWP